MAKYNLEDDTPSGIASADFPTTFYDRPQLMFGNLLRGDVDGITRAMLSPDTLTPTQMKSVRDVLMPGKRVNPILKTITDIATNPLVIAGLVVGLWKFPIGTTDSLLALRKGLLPKAAAMGQIFSGLHGAMMNLRTVPGLYEKLSGVTTATTEFVSRHTKSASDIFEAAGPLSKADAMAVAARLDGLHLAEHDMVKLFGNEPEYVALMEGKNAPIAAGLQGKMSSKAVGLADRLRGWLNGIRGEFTKDEEVDKRMRRAAANRGMAYGEDVENYWPRATEFNKYDKSSIRGASGTDYRKIEAKIGGSFAERPGSSMPSLADLKVMEDAGMIKSGFTTMARTILDRWSEEGGQTAGRIWNDVRRAVPGDAEQRTEFVKRMMYHYTEGKGKELNFVARFGKPKTAASVLDMMAASLQDAQTGGPEAMAQELHHIGSVLAEPPSYSLSLHKALGKYVGTVAPDWAWHGTGLGSEIMGIVNKPNVFAHAPWMESYVKDDLIPHVRGMKSTTQLARSLSYSVRNEKILNWIENHPMVESIIGKGNQEWLKNYFGDTKSRSLSSVSGSIAHYFYLSTLGLNVGSTAKLAMHPFLTTINAPGIGVGGIWRGLMGYAGEEGLLSRMGRYVGARIEGVAHEEAFRSAFPDFVKDTGSFGRGVSDIIQEETRLISPVRAQLGQAGEVAKTVMMGPFQAVASTNRLIAYYAGKNSYLFHNAARLAEASVGERAAIMQEAGEVGQTLHSIATFPGGPLEVPKMIMNLSPAARMFMTFPLRYMSFLQGSVRLGADPTKLDWGTIGRALAGSTAAYITARNMLGVDISKSLMAGAMPIPEYSNSPFYPFPFVPPILEIPGEATMALLSGNLSQMKSVAALAIPGGVALQRAYRTFSPHYADYENPTPDGRIPLYSNNQSLIGTLSPMELTLRAVGLRPTSVQAEMGAAKWLASQRDRVRGYRRDYTQAMSENDTGKAENIQAEFKRVYPELGELQVKKSDIQSLENRKTISRLTRVEKGIPTAYRPIFSQIIGEAGLGRMTEDIQQGGPDQAMSYFAQLQ